MGLAYIVVAIAGAAYAGRAIHSPFVDGDLFWQKHLGAYVLAHHALPTALGDETFTAAGAPWVPQEWLLGIAASLAISHGVIWALALAAGVALSAGLILTAMRAKGAGASGFAIALAAGLLVVDVEGSYGIRAQVFAWPLFCGLLYALDRRGRAVYAVLPLIALWANVHASAMLAIPVIWIDAAIAPFTFGFRDPETRRRVVVALLAPFATLFTPLGVKLPLYAIALIGSPIRHSISEWQPIALKHDFFWYGGAPLLLLTLLAIRTLVRERPRDVAWAALLAGMTILAVRNAALLGFVLVPLAARAIDVLLGRFSWWPYDPLRSTGPRRLAWIATAFTAIVVLLVNVLTPAGKGNFAPPVATFARAATLPGERRVFCYDFAVCSIALDYPNLRVFMDGRADPYPVPVWDDFNTVRWARVRWGDTLDRYGVDTAIVKKNDALDKVLAKDREWKSLPQADPCCRIYWRVAPLSANRVPDLAQAGRASVEQHAHAIQPAGGDRNQR